MGRPSLSHDLQNGHTVNTGEGSALSGYEALVRPTSEGACSLDVVVGGVHCAACIQKIESTLSAQSDVESARLNFSTRRLNIRWHGLPERGNELVALVQKLGYDVRPFDARANQEESEEEKFLLICLGVAGFAMGNIMLLSVGLWSTDTQTMGMATHDFLHWISALIAIPAVIFSGRPFFRSAFKALSHGQSNMDVPISVGVLLACIMSFGEVLRHAEHVYFDSAVMLLFFLLIGRYLDFRARRHARSAATDLLSTLSGFARVVENGKTRNLPIRDLKEGMVVLVAAGEKFPVDGEVVEGIAEVDTSLVTGETLPRLVSLGGDVYAGTMNLSGPVTLRVAKAAEDSLLSDIVRLMEKAEQGQAQYVRLADRVASLYTPVVHLLAVSAFVLWWGVMGIAWQDALMISVTVLIITCPCALGLAVPVVQVLATGRLMKTHVIVKSGDALERLAKADAVIFDKTGTLTLGHPKLESAGNPEDLKLAASLASHSRHPLSQALAEAYDGPVSTLTDVEEFPGQGLSGSFQGKKVKIGSRAWCGLADASAAKGPELWLAFEGHKPVVFTFTDALREDAAETIAKLRRDGLKVVLLSGDRKDVASDIALKAGIEADHVYAEKTPPEKFQILEDLKSKGHNVLMVGDGLNDAPVLAGADVSMAPGTAVDMAQSAADIVFMGKALSPVYDTRSVAVFSQRLVKQNFMLALVYNLVAIPLGFVGLVTPMVAALAMSGSSLIVIANSFRLRGRL
ncbi:MAG: cadmium-translocating P-type ATPase [Alphaproteobacteria bacterium]|nr:cadmium-translocating P-type ATPase [Alphaproteobacteria bacterium]